MPASAPPYVGRLHGVLAVLPSTRIASVAHVELDQSFPNCNRRWQVAGLLLAGNSVTKARKYGLDPDARNPRIRVCVSEPARTEPEHVWEPLSMAAMPGEGSNSPRF